MKLVKFLIKKGFLVQGSTRNVFLFKNLAIKIPRFKSLSSFYRGLLCNVQENKIYFNHKCPRLCPIKHSVYGFILIMRKLKICCNDEMGSYLDRDLWANKYKNDCNDSECNLNFSDTKEENFGWLNNKIVRVDYGDDWICPKCLKNTYCS